MNTAPAPAFASATDAVDMVRAGLRLLATADATQMTPEERARCLRGLEKSRRGRHRRPDLDAGRLRRRAGLRR